MYDYEKTTRSPFHNDNRKSTLVTRADWRILSDRSFVGRKTVTGWISKFGKKPFPGNPVFLSIFVRAGRSFAGRLISKNVEKTDFDPNAPGVNNGRYFGLPFTPEQARLVLMSVPWDVTTSYREGRPAAPMQSWTLRCRSICTTCTIRTVGGRESGRCRSAIRWNCAVKIAGRGSAGDRTLGIGRYGRRIGAPPYRAGQRRFRKTQCGSVRRGLPMAGRR